MRTRRTFAQAMLLLGALAVLSPADLFHKQGLLPARTTATDVSIWKPGS